MDEGEDGGGGGAGVARVAATPLMTSRATGLGCNKRGEHWAVSDRVDGTVARAGGEAMSTTNLSRKA